MRTRNPLQVIEALYEISLVAVELGRATKVTLVYQEKVSVIECFVHECVTLGTEIQFI